jgi:flagellar motor switch protein FliM
MADESQKLSQAEIDALLGLLPQDAGTEEPEKSSPDTVPAQEQNIQPYDFHSPVKFSKEQVWVLQMIHEHLAKRLTPTLSVYLRSKVQVNLSSLEQGNYTVFMASMPSPNIIHLVSLRPLPGRIILGIELNLAMAFMDRMLGGPGEVQAKSRELTSLGLGLVRKLMKHILVELKASWDNILEVEPEIDDVTMNPLFAGVAFPTDSVVLAMFDVFFQDVSGSISIIIPFSVLDPIAKDLNSDMWGRGTTHSSTEADQLLWQQLATHLTRVKIPLSMRMTASHLDLAEIASLRAGDIFLLDTRRDGLVKIFVGDRHKYWGRPGTVGNRMAVQIEQIIKAEPAEMAIPDVLDGKEVMDDQNSTMDDQPPVSDDRYNVAWSDAIALG